MPVRKLARRTVLRGAGAAMALPLLEIMQSSSWGKDPANDSNSPRRAAFFYVPNGVEQTAWHPKETGIGFKLSPTLKPLEPVREHIALFTNLDRIKVPGTDGHAQASTCWLSSAAPDQLSPAGYPLKRTLDQIIADTTGTFTPFRSLELSCNPYEDNKESVYFDNVSWYGHGHVARSQRDPQKVFDRLFAIKSDSQNEKRSGRSRPASVLDLVKADAKSLRPQLGQLDREKLDEYLESVRTVEKQLALLKSRRPVIEAISPQVPETPWQELRRDEFIQLMGDLMILALRCDLTRVASLMVAPERWSTPQVVHGVFKAPVLHHSWTHGQDNPHVKAQLAKLDNFHMQQFAMLVKKMAAIREGEHSLLESMLFTFGSGLSSGKTHVYSNLPIVVAGNGHGRLKTNRHHQSQVGTPVANMWLAIAQAMGSPIKKYGDNTGIVPLA